jgi:tetratricopeptide (TPR) repeat protein
VTTAGSHKANPQVPGGGQAEPLVHLRAEAARLAAAHPFAALSVDPGAGRAEIRARFLELTKRYHPNRYARQEAETRRVANEVFLAIKRAYETLVDDRRREKLMTELGLASDRQAAVPVELQAIPAPMEVGPTGATRPAASPAFPRAGTIPMGAPPAAQSPPRPPVARALRPGSAGRRSARSGSRAQPADDRSSAGQQLGTKRGHPIASPANLPARGSTRRELADTSAIQQAAQNTKQRANEAYEHALKLLSVGRLGEARKALHQLAAEQPQTKKYRVQMHYAWGLEHEEAGRLDDARAELERALALDGEFKRAHEALDRLPGPKKGKFFSKIFGR